MTPPIERHGVFGGQPVSCGEMRNKAKGGPAGLVFDQLHRRVEEARVAAEFVDEEAADHGRVGRIDHRFRADDLGDHAAAVDIAQDDDRNIGRAGKSHIGEIASPEIDLGGGTRTFDKNEIRLGLQSIEAFENGRHEPGLHGLELAGPGTACHSAMNHDLGADFALRLEENRVHVDAGLHTAGPRLQGLRAANFSAVDCHGGIV